MSEQPAGPLIRALLCLTQMDSRSAHMGASQSQTATFRQLATLNLARVVDERCTMTVALSPVESADLAEFMGATPAGSERTFALEIREEVHLVPESRLIPQSDLQIPRPPGSQPPPRSRFTSAFALRDRVTIDGDPSIVGVVTGLMWNTDEADQVRVNWMHNGDSRSAWLDHWRLTRVTGG